MYSEITTQDDISFFQTDINRLSAWSNNWQMNFNLTKCNIITITRSTIDQTACYCIQKHKLENISRHKYLGIIIQDNPQCDSHVREVKAKAKTSWGSCADIFPTTTPRSKNRPVTPLLDQESSVPFLRGPLTRSNTLHLSQRSTNERGPWMGDT